MIEPSNMIGETLDEAVKKFPADYTIRIGAGSGYLFIGTKKEYKRDIDRISESCLCKAKNKIQQAEAKCVNKKELLAAMEKLDQFVHLRVRPVIDCYESDLPDAVDTWSLIIDGDEQGNNWTEAEYRKDYKSSN